MGREHHSPARCKVESNLAPSFRSQEGAPDLARITSGIKIVTLVLLHKSGLRSSLPDHLVG